MDFDVLTIALAVVGANASVAMLFGIIPTWYGIWDKAGISDLGKLVLNMSMPALVFSKVLYQISEGFVYSTCSALTSLCGL